MVFAQAVGAGLKTLGQWLLSCYLETTSSFAGSVRPDLHERNVSLGRSGYSNT